MSGPKWSAKVTCCGQKVKLSTYDEDEDANLHEGEVWLTTSVSGDCPQCGSVYECRQDRKLK